LIPVGEKKRKTVENEYDRGRQNYPSRGAPPFVPLVKNKRVAEHLADAAVHFALLLMQASNFAKAPGLPLVEAAKRDASQD